MAGMPRELAEMLGLIQPRDTSKQVVVTELQGDELRIFEESQKLKNEMLKLIKKLERMKKQEEICSSEMWELVEHRLQTPPDASMELNSRTKQVTMDRDEADFLKISYLDQSVHPEHRETDKQAYADHHRPR